MTRTEPELGLGIGTDVNGIKNTIICQTQTVEEGRTKTCSQSLVCAKNMIPFISTMLPS